MTKKEFIDMLADVPDDFIVILASDSEGNSYSPLSDYSVGLYIPDSTYSGEVIAEDEIDDDEKDVAE